MTRNPTLCCLLVLHWRFPSSLNFFADRSEIPDDIKQWRHWQPYYFSSHQQTAYNNVIPQETTFFRYVAQHLTNSTLILVYMCWEGSNRMVRSRPRMATSINCDDDNRRDFVEKSITGAATVTASSWLGGVPNSKAAKSTAWSQVRTCALLNSTQPASYLGTLSRWRTGRCRRRYHAFWYCFWFWRTGMCLIDKSHDTFTWLDWICSGNISAPRKYVVEESWLRRGREGIIVWTPKPKL